MADITSILEYYSNLLVIQYNSKEKAKATIELLVNTILADGLVFDTRDAFNLDDAVGVQLDIIGKWVGVDRFYSDESFGDSVFGFADAHNVGSVSANITGFDDAAAPDKTGVFTDAEGVISNGVALTDDNYRIIIKFKIAQNNIDHSNKSIDDALFETFGTELFAKDNYDMTMSYLIVGLDEVLINALVQKDLLLRPMAVGVDVVVLKNKVFSFADATNTGSIGGYQVGFNDATAGLIKDGTFINAKTDVLYI